MTREQVKRKVFRYLGDLDPKIRTKFNNICGKTGQYDVPTELFQKRTSRKNRVLLPWKAVKENALTLEQLQTFEGGVAVEFVNEDYFLPENRENPVFRELCSRIGSDDTVSAIISFRSESGSSSSAVQRSWFSRFLEHTAVTYRGEQVTITEDNYKDYAIGRCKSGGAGNEKWNGFLYVSIRGGQQDTIETHKGTELPIFNPACEYASEEVCIDLDLVMSYFALWSIDRSTLGTGEQSKLDQIIGEVEAALSASRYDHLTFCGNLLDYCRNHPCLKMIRGELTDPIRVEKIDIGDFAIDSKADLRCLDFTHDEAVIKEKFYWDSEKQVLLSPARPTNVFWSKHLSNMMQQNFSLEEYFEHEREIVERRAELLRIGS